jgi:surfeit locus 1 family protein
MADGTPDTGRTGRPPLLATIIVLAAVVTMIGLGVWQLRRAEWKDGVLRELAAAAHQPAVAYPAPPVADALPLFRRSAVTCLSVAGWRATSGRNRAGESGWIHVASCRTGAEGPGAQVVVGWSRDDANPAWAGGRVTGTIAPDSRSLIRLVADDAPAGLMPAAPPNIDSIPNNHRAYAVQWFAFAAIALVVYVVALRSRARRSR